MDELITVAGMTTISVPIKFEKNTTVSLIHATYFSQDWILKCSISKTERGPCIIGKNGDWRFFPMKSKSLEFTTGKLPWAISEGDYFLNVTNSSNADTAISISITKGA